MPYGSAQGLYDQWGRQNIRKWADLENHDEASYIDGRIAWALGKADTTINSRLAEARYVIPFAEPYDDLIVDLANRIAGLRLYDARGITDSDDDFDDFRNEREAIEDTLMKIIRGQMHVRTAERKANQTSVPKVYPLRQVDSSVDNSPYM